MSFISIIIPAFNESGNIAQVVGSIKNVGAEYEILVIDDGSTDGTAEAAASAGAKVIKHPYNLGYGAALKTGIRRSSGDVIVIIDADLQHQGEEIGKICSHLIGNGYDMVVGVRNKWSHRPLSRRLGKLVLTAVASYLANRKIPDLNSGFRAIRKDAVKEFLPILPNGFSFTTTITLAFIQEGFSIGYMPITVLPRRGKKSRLNIVTDGYRTLLIILRIIMLFNPLKIFIPASAVLLISGFIYGTLSALSDMNIPDGSILCILAGIILFCFGLIADQTSQMRLQLKNK